MISRIKPDAQHDTQPKKENRGAGEILTAKPYGENCAD